MDGRTGKATAHRITASWDLFFSNSQVWFGTKGLKEEKLRLLERMVPASLFWASGTWTLTKEDRYRLRSTQLEMYRRVLGLWPRPRESREAFLTRSAELCREKMKDIGAKDWADVAVGKHYDWAATLMKRGEEYPASRPYRATTDRNCLEIEMLKGLQHGLLRTGHYYRQWRWEQPLFDWNHDWQKLVRYPGCRSSYICSRLLPYRALAQPVG